MDLSASTLVKGVNIQKNHVLMFYPIKKKFCQWASTISTKNDKQTGINRISQRLWSKWCGQQIQDNALRKGKKHKQLPNKYKIMC